MPSRRSATARVRAGPCTITTDSTTPSAGDEWCTERIAGTGRIAGTPRALLNKLYPTQVGFKKYGKSGIEVSDWFPHTGACADDIAVVRWMWTTDNDHAAQLQFHTGRHVFEGFHPTIGSWVHYALGSLSDNLPQFAVMGQPIADCWHFTAFDSPRAIAPEALLEELKALYGTTTEATCHPCIESALAAARKSSQRVLATGSLYLAGEVLAQLRGEKQWFQRSAQ